MALQLEVITQFGATANYWRIMPTMSVDFGSATTVQTINACMKCYLSQQARLDGANPIDGLEQFITLSGADAEAALATGDPRAALYAQVKLLEQFVNAVDC